jgi:hypothetical protein
MIELMDRNVFNERFIVSSENISYEKLFSLIALVNSGFVKIPALEFKNKWLIILIMGILMYLFASGLGGILVIIGAILFIL